MFRRLGADESQGRLWSVLAGLLLLSLYVIAFIVKNDDRIQIDFVLFTAGVSLIWLIVFTFALGVLGGVLFTQIYRRRRAQQRREPGPGVGQVGGRGEAEREPGG
jgi:uncharacterized integral membrane protein